MKLIAMMAVRSEDWCLGLTARAVLQWCDELILRDHCSTDDSREIEQHIWAEFPGRVTVLYDDDPVWREMAHRNELLCTARDRGATHLAYVDADELLVGNMLPSIRGWVERLPAGDMLSLPWLCLKAEKHIGALHVPKEGCGVPGDYDTWTFGNMSTGMWASQNASVCFRDEPFLHWKAREGYDFHQRQPMGRTWRDVNPVGKYRRTSGLMHLQFLSERRLIAKHALYEITEVLRWPGRRTADQINEMYHRTVREAAAAQCTPVPAEWLEPYRALLPHLHIDTEPWQEQVVRDLIAEHGIEKFKGLDLFGVI